DVVLGLEAVLEHFELQCAYHSEDRKGVTPARMAKDLHNPFLGQLLQAFAKLFAAQRIAHAHVSKVLGREPRHALVLEHTPLTQGVANAKVARRVEQTDDISRPSLFDDLSLLREEVEWLAQLEVLLQPSV